MLKRTYHTWHFMLVGPESRFVVLAVVVVVVVVFVAGSTTHERTGWASV